MHSLMQILWIIICTIVATTAETPEVFRRSDLWRQQPFDPRKFPAEDRYSLQEKWVERVLQSEFMRNSTRKKHILLTGNWGELEERDKNLVCHNENLNFSQHCSLSFYGYPPNVYPMYSNYDDFDAVVARRDWNFNFQEPPLPPRIVPFFSIFESPYTLHEGDFRVNHPILASYWRGSDIFAPYFKWIPDNTNATLDRRNYADGKKKLVAIIVSHCPTYNDRMRFVYKLQEYIPVDIYGTCGPHNCGDYCLDKISAEYKFYLAFENANCRDYITEKFFINALGNNLVPIVLGAHPDDYKWASPPHSYIHVEDFPSVAALAEALLALDKDDEAYNAYFRWKGTGRIVNGHDDLFCKVCAFLYYSDFHPPPKWPEGSYRWLQVNPCLKIGEHFWNKDASLML